MSVGPDGLASNLHQRQASSCYIWSLESCLNPQNSFFHGPVLGMALLVPLRHFDIVWIPQNKKLASDPKPESRHGPSLDLLGLKSWRFCSHRLSLFMACPIVLAGFGEGSVRA